MISMISKLITRLLTSITFILSGLVACIHLRFITEILSNITSINTSNIDINLIRQSALLVRDFAIGLISQEQLANNLSNIGINPALLSDSMINHLKDCIPLFQILTNIFIYCLIATLIFWILCLLLKGKYSYLLLLRQSCILTFLIIIAFILWIVFDFNGFFSWLHSLFFASGTWTFDANSLLINMYPTNFWIGMGVVWASISLFISLIFLIISIKVK